MEGTCPSMERTRSFMEETFSFMEGTFSYMEKMKEEDWLSKTKYPSH